MAALISKAKRRCVRRAIIETSDEDGDNKEDDIQSKRLKRSSSAESWGNPEKTAVPCSESTVKPERKARVPKKESAVKRQIERKADSKMGLCNSKKKKEQGTITSQAKPKPEDNAEAYLARLQASDVNLVEWTHIDYVREENGISHRTAETVVKLLDNDNTIPFIARYRKDKTGGMEADELRRVKNSYDRAKLIKQKAACIIRDMDKHGKWTPEFHSLVQSSKSLNDLEHIHSLFKTTKSTLAERARDVGLGGTAEGILEGRASCPLSHLVNSSVEGLQTEEQVKNGLIYIMADVMNKDRRTFEKIKELRSVFSMQIQTERAKVTAKTESAKSEKQKSEESKYELYHKFSISEANIQPHQILAINRGEARKFLTVKVIIPAAFEKAVKKHCFQQYSQALNASPLHKSLVNEAVEHMYNKSVKTSVKRRTRHELSEKADIASIDVFAENVKQLLLIAPVRGRVVLGIDPGFRHGCKLAVVSEQGDVLETDTIYPHDRKQEAESRLAHLVTKHKCTVFALGNGTACRETEAFISDLITKGAFEPLKVAYEIVDETGASIYSCSPEAAAEFPNLNVNLISAVSIARRLQDPMAELVKIEPKHLGVGMYQHDLPEKQLAAKLNEVVTEAVSFVGVDVNTSSVSLLKRVAGLGESKAKNIVEFRRCSGPLRGRKELMKVKGIGNATFEQCAGFVRVVPETAVDKVRRKVRQEPFEPLDRTWIHPESYEIAKKLVKAAQCDLSQLGTKIFISGINVFVGSQSREALATRFETTLETIDVIINGLKMENGKDIRGKGDVHVFRKSITTINDLKVGTLLTGVIRNVTHFGAFVDVGVENNGLLHKNCTNGMWGSLSVGQRVETKVKNLEKERGRIGLTLVRCI